jgi:hypothetical protein
VCAGARLEILLGLLHVCVIFYVTQVANLAIFVIFPPQSLCNLCQRVLELNINIHRCNSGSNVNGQCNSTIHTVIPFSMSILYINTRATWHDLRFGLLASMALCLHLRHVPVIFRTMASFFACLLHASISGSPGDTLACITKSLLKPSCCDCSVPWHRTFHLGRFQGVARVGFHVCDLPPLSSPCWYTLIYSKSNQNCLNQFLCSSSTKTRSLTRFSWIPSFYFLFNFFLIFFFDFLNTRPSTRKLCLCRRRPCLRKKHPEFFWL